MRVLVSLLALASCITDDAVDDILDSDGDGYVTAAVQDGTDCDDADAAVHPGAAEMCGDGADNDCDGVIDDDGVGALTLYADVDGDGHGDAGAPRSACAEVPGLTALAGDCDDDDPTRHPGAAETCNGVDDDCDDAVDDGLPSDTWYADADGDGHGDGSSEQVGCEAPEGYVSTGDDCDDEDAAVNPAVEESWYDGIDADCDGQDDDDQDGDGSASDAHGGDDCDDLDPTVHPGAVDACGNGVDVDCSDAFSACRLSGSTDLAAVAIATIQADQVADGDADGDGLADLLAVTGGGAYLLLGPFDGTYGDGDARGTFPVVGARGLLGGDLDADGSDDVLLVTEDALFGFIGSSFSGILTESEAGLRLSAGEGGLFVSAAFLPDSTGDGSDGVLVCERTVAGASAVVYADIQLGSGSEPVPAARVSGVAGEFGSVAPTGLAGGASSFVGRSDVHSAELFMVTAPFRSGPLSDVGISVTGPLPFIRPPTSDFDTNGDGAHDLLVGVPSTSAAVFLFHGPIAEPRALADAVEIRVAGATSEFGWSTAAGDLDGDGFDDLIIGDPTGPIGATYVLYGPSDPGAAVITDVDAVLRGAGGSRIGTSVAAADTNGDGYQDVVVSGGAETFIVPGSGD